MAISLCSATANNNTHAKCPENWVNPIQEIELKPKKLTQYEINRLVPTHFRSAEHEQMCRELLNNVSIDQLL